MEANHFENAKIFKAFGDETRLAILEMLRSGEKCACVLLEKVKVGQSTLSHHMKILLESGVVSARKKGKWTYYSICESGRERALALLQAITQPHVNTEETAKNDCEHDCE